MFFFLFRRPKYHYVWQNADHDIPVKFIRIAGRYGNEEYAEVEFEGKRSYVPAKEVVWVVKK